MKNERGILLMSVLLLVLVVSALGTTMLVRSRTMLVSATTAVTDEQALQAADGGVETARAALLRDPAWAGETVRIGSMEVEVHVDRHDVGWSVHSRARPGGVRLEVQLRADGENLPLVRAWHRTR